MTFQDIFKSDFLNNVTSFSLMDTVMALVLSFVLGLFIFLIYKKTFQGVMYSSTFGLSLVAISMITTLVILAVTSNVVLSLGMVGALSIVRFRTAIKEPMDIAFLFWSIAIGIVLGAGMLPLAVFGSLFIGVILAVFANRKTHDKPYLLVLQYDDSRLEEELFQAVKAASKRFIIKSKTVTSLETETTIEVRIPDMETGFVNELAGRPGVHQAVLVSYNGEYLG